MKQEQKYLVYTRDTGAKYLTRRANVRVTGPGYRWVKSKTRAATLTLGAARAAARRYKGEVVPA
jgi:hypothetical protein